MRRILLSLGVASLVTGCAFVLEFPSDFNDAGVDGGPDLREDGGRDAGDGVDAGAPSDAGLDAGRTAPTAVPAPRAPLNGATTGSIRIADSVRRSMVLRPELRWAAVADASRYQVQIDDSCPVLGYRSCFFESPEVDDATITGTRWRPGLDLAVSTSAPVGRRYFWRVRACNEGGCGPWSTARYVDVGRLHDDLNGDGYSDRVLAGYRYDDGGPNAGRVRVLLNDAPGSLGTMTEWHAFVGEPGDNIGSSVAMVGDVNADGYADFAFGAPLYMTTATVGGAWIYLGAPDTSSPPVLFAELTGIPGWRFGRSVAGAGDVDADGFADVAVGADGPAGGGRIGSVDVYRGQTAVPGTAAVWAHLDGSFAEGHFGEAVSTAGDVNGDGFADLVVGRPGVDGPSSESSAGAATVYLGELSPGGGGPVVWATFEGALADGRLGGAVAGGCDLTDDGLSDVVVGQGTTDNAGTAGEGRLWVYAGSDGAAPTDSLWDRAPDPYTGRFDAEVDCGGDVNGDGVDDLIIGWSLVPSGGQGEVRVFTGGSTITEWTRVAGVAPGDDFGSSVALGGDVNADGFADFTVGALGDDPGGEGAAGSVSIFLGDPIAPVSGASLFFAMDGEQADEFFGAAVAWLRAPRRPTASIPLVPGPG